MRWPGLTDVTSPELQERALAALETRHPSQNYHSETYLRPDLVLSGSEGSLAVEARFVQQLADRWRLTIERADDGVVWYTVQKLTSVFNKKLSKTHLIINKIFMQVC